MKLRKFISEAVLEITEGIKDSNRKDIKVGLYSPGKNDQRHVEFDVAVSAKTKNKGEVSGGIRVVEIFGFGGKKEKEISNSSISRIKFGIRIY